MNAPLRPLLLMLSSIPALCHGAAGQAALLPDLQERLDNWRRSHGPAWQVEAALGGAHSQFLWGGRSSAPIRPQSDGDFVDLALLALTEAAPLHGIDPRSLALDRVRYLPLGSIGASDKVTVRFEQALDGVPVHQGSANVLLDEDGSVLSIQTLGVPEVFEVDTTPLTSPALASGRATELFRADTARVVGSLGEPELVIVREHREGRRVPVLSWAVDVMSRTDGRRPEGSTYWIDARDGRLVGRESLVFDFDVTGTVYTDATPPDRADIHDGPDNEPEVVPLPYVEMRSSSHATIYSDANGDFSFPGNGPVLDLEISYDGLYVAVDNVFGGFGEYVYEDPSLAGENNVLLLNDDPNMPGEPPQPQRISTTQANAYVTITALRDWITFINPQDDTADFQAIATMNDITLECFGGKFSKNNPHLFFPRGNGQDCYHGSFSTIVAHEMGHWLAWLYGNGSGGAIGEGTADVFAMYLYDTPDWAEDYCLNAAQCTANSGPVRSGENQRSFCGFDDGALVQDCHPGSYHGNGQVWMGVAWKIRENLHATYGDDPGEYGQGDFVADNLFLAWMNAYDQFQIHPVIEKQWLVLDDNDGNICNGTPHYDDIDDGFQQHGFPAPTLPGMCFAIDDVIYPKFPGDEVGPYLVSAAIDPPPGSGIASATLHYSVDGGAFREEPMTSDATSNRYEGGIPGQTSGARVELYISVQDAAGGMATWPPQAPAELVAMHVGKLITTFRDDFETDLGWTVVNENLDAGTWERVDPVGTEYQPEDDYGPGTHCFVTGQAQAGDGPLDHEVKGGPTYLLSPPIALGGFRTFVSFACWMVNPLGDDALVVEVAPVGPFSAARGGAWTPLAEMAGDDLGWWVDDAILEFEPPSPGLYRFRLGVADAPDNDVFEAAIDAFEVRELGPVGP